MSSFLVGRQIMFSSSKLQVKHAKKASNIIDYESAHSLDQDSNVWDYSRSIFFTSKSDHENSVKQYFDSMLDPRLPSKLKNLYDSFFANHTFGPIIVHEILNEFKRVTGADICHRAALIDVSNRIANDPKLLIDGLDSILFVLFCPSGLKCGIGGDTCTGADLGKTIKTITDLHQETGKTIGSFGCEMQQCCPRVLNDVHLPSPLNSQPVKAPVVVGLPVPGINLGVPVGQGAGGGIIVAPQNPPQVDPIPPEGPCNIDAVDERGHQSSEISLWIIKIILLLFYKSKVNLKSIIFFGSHVRRVVDLVQVDNDYYLSRNVLLNESLILFAESRLSVLDHPANLITSRTIKRIFHRKQDLPVLENSKSKTPLEKDYSDYSDSRMIEIIQRRNYLLTREVAMFLSKVNSLSFIDTAEKIFKYQVDSLDQANHLMHRPIHKFSEMSSVYASVGSIYSFDLLVSRSLDLFLNCGIFPKNMHSSASDLNTSNSTHASFIQSNLPSRTKIIPKIIKDDNTMKCEFIEIMSNGSKIICDVPLLAELNNKIYNRTIGLSEIKGKMNDFRYKACLKTIGNMLNCAKEFIK